jgi:protein gp37
MRLAGTRMKSHPSREGLTIDTKSGPVWNGKVRLVESALLTPLRWQRSRTIFWNAHGDLFHPNVPDAWIDRQFAVMALTPQHRHLVLTKRADRQRDYVNGMWKDDAAHLRRMTEAVNWVFRRSGRTWGDCHSTSSYITTAGREGASGAREPCMLRGTGDGGAERLVQWTDEGETWRRVSDQFAAKLPEWSKSTREFGWGLKQWPLPNLWLGVSVEDQARANERIPALLATYAEGRFLSCEPLLGPVVLADVPAEVGGTTRNLFGPLAGYCRRHFPRADCGCKEQQPKIDGVIVGGESGPGSRPMHPDWARSLRDQCADAGTDFHFKQWGDWVPDVGAVDGWTIPDDPEVSKYLHRDWEGDHFGEPYARGWMDEVEFDTVSRIGKKLAGRQLDGVTHDALPWSREP